MANTEGASPSQARRLWGLESVVSSPSRVLDKASVDIGSVQRFLQTPKHQEKGSLSWESASSEGPKIKAKSGSVVWEGAASPFPPARRSGECCKLPHWGSAKSPTAQKFYTTFGT